MPAITKAEFIGLGGRLMTSKKILSHEEPVSKMLENPEAKTEISPKELLRGALRKPATPVTIEQMNRAIEQGATYAECDFSKPSKG